MQDVKHLTKVILTPEHESDELLSPKCNHSHVLFTRATYLEEIKCEGTVLSCELTPLELDTGG